MDLQGRIEALRSCEFSTGEESEALRGIVELLQEQYGLPLSEENGGVMVTHIAAALRRRRTGEEIPELDAEVVRQMRASALYETAGGMAAQALAILGPLPPHEADYLTLHLCNLLEAAQ